MSRVIPSAAFGLSLCAAVGGAWRADAQRPQSDPPADESAQERPQTGLVRCDVRENGEPAAGRVSAAGHGSATCEAGLPLPPGSHTVELHLPTLLFDVPRVRQVTVEAGATAMAHATFETGELWLWAPTPAGPRPTGAIWHDGEIRAQLEHDSVARLPIGTYVIDARAGDTSQRFEAVHVHPNGRTALVWQTR